MSNEKHPTKSMVDEILDEFLYQLSQESKFGSARTEGFRKLRQEGVLNDAVRIEATITGSDSNQ